MIGPGVCYGPDLTDIAGGLVHLLSCGTADSGLARTYIPATAPLLIKMTSGMV